MFFLKRSICLIDGTQTGTTSMGQQPPGSNNNVQDIPTFLHLRNWGLTIRCCPVSGHPFFLVGILTPLRGIQSAYSKPR